MDTLILFRWPCSQEREQCRDEIHQWSSYQPKWKKFAKCPRPSFSLLQKHLVGWAIGLNSVNWNRWDTIHLPSPKCYQAAQKEEEEFRYAQGHPHISLRASQWTSPYKLTGIAHSFRETGCPFYGNALLYLSKVSVGCVRDKETRSEKVRNVRRPRRALETEVLLSLGQRFAWSGLAFTCCPCRNFIISR